MHDRREQANIAFTHRWICCIIKPVMAGGGSSQQGLSGMAGARPECHFPETKLWQREIGLVMQGNGKSVVVIGAGPAGYSAAIRASQLGARVTLIEKEHIGGTCLNVGCIPTKALAESADVFRHTKHLAEYGIRAGEVALDFGRVMNRKSTIVKRLVAGLRQLLTANGVTIVSGKASLVSPREVAVTAEDGKSERFTADRIILATGSVEKVIPGLEPDGDSVVTSTDALDFRGAPGSMVIVGAGVIGCEFASIYAEFGTKVTLVEMMPQAIPGEDAEAVKELVREFTKRGIRLYVSSRVTGIEDAPGNGGGAKKVVHVESPEGHIDIAAEKVLVAVGRAPYIGELGLDRLGIKTERGRIIVDEHLETSEPGIFAAGDVIGGYQLAHVAFEEGVAAAENALGVPGKLDLTAVPRCIFTSPNLAGVGLTETAAREKYGDILVGRFPFAASGKALAEGSTAGFAKVVARSSDRRIVGATIVGAHATELIAEVTLAISLGATLEDLGDTIHAHPTLAEAVKEAALAALGRPIHIPAQKRS